MHVGVCIRVNAESLEDAKDLAQNVLYQNSHTEEVFDHEIYLSLKDFYKSLGRDEELDEEGIKLFIEVEDSEDLYYDLLEENFLDRAYYELEFNSEWFELPLGREILKLIKNTYYDEQLEDTWFFSEDTKIEIVDGEVRIPFSLQISSGLWDYDYGPTENFGLHEDENGTFRIWSCNSKNINQKFLKVLFGEDENDHQKILQMFDYWVDDERNEFPNDITTIREMFSENINNNTYFIVASVHV